MHVTEEGRVIGFTMERIINCRHATPEDLALYQQRVSKSHLLSIKHGDINKHSFLIHDDRATLIDFDCALHCDNAEVLEEKFRGLEKELNDTSGRGGRVVETGSEEWDYMMAGGWDNCYFSVVVGPYVFTLVLRAEILYPVLFAMRMEHRVVRTRLPMNRWTLRDIPVLTSLIMPLSRHLRLELSRLLPRAQRALIRPVPLLHFTFKTLFSELFTIANLLMGFASSTIFAHWTFTRGRCLTRTFLIHQLTFYMPRSTFTRRVSWMFASLTMVYEPASRYCSSRLSIGSGSVWSTRKGCLSLPVDVLNSRKIGKRSLLVRSNPFRKRCQSMASANIP